VSTSQDLWWVLTYDLKTPEGSSPHQAMCSSRDYLIKHLKRAREIAPTKGWEISDAKLVGPSGEEETL
jgi:hypothetical protein